MEKYFDLILKCPLFDGIKKEDLTGLLSCLEAKKVKFYRDFPILSEGEKPEHLGIILSGNARVETVDYMGNTNILSLLESGDIFAEAFVLGQTDALPIWVTGAGEGEALFIKGEKIVSSCGNVCDFHSQIVKNLLKIMARKNMYLNQKAQITSKRTTSEKLMAYLLICAKEKGQTAFTIPFNRQQLADYLAVDRSGLSAEISKLKNKGIIDNKGSFFVLKNGI